MAARTLSFRRFRADQIRDAHLLVIDDVRVTGAHQRSLTRASDQLPLAARTFLYIASFWSPAAGCFDPTQEDALNHAAVKTLDQLAGIVAADDFAWNVRVCKFVLSPAHRDRLAQFLGRMPHWFVRDLARNARRDGYAQMGPYAPSHAMVLAELAGVTPGPSRLEFPARCRAPARGTRRRGRRVRRPDRHPACGCCRGGACSFGCLHRRPAGAGRPSGSGGSPGSWPRAAATAAALTPCHRCGA